MDQIVAKEKAFNQRVTIDYQYFIQSAVQQKLSWNTLAYFLTDLAPTLNKSRQVIKILVQELEKWVLKVEFKEDSIFTENVSENKELAENIHDGDQNSLASSEMSDSEDDILEDTIEVTNDDLDIDGDKNEHILSFIEKKETLSEEAILFDKVGKQLYEFVGDDYDVPKELMAAT